MCIYMSKMVLVNLAGWLGGLAQQSKLPSVLQVASFFCGAHFLLVAARLLTSGSVRAAANTQSSISTLP